MSQLATPVSAADHALGPANARVTLVEYADFQCPYCATAHSVVRDLVMRMPEDVRFVFRHFPLAEIHPHAEHAAEFAEAAGEQGRFFETCDYLFSHQRRLSDADLGTAIGPLGLDAEVLRAALDSGEAAARVQEQFDDGTASEVEGTPTFFIDGEKYEGDWSTPGALLAAVQDALG